MAYNNLSENMKLLVDKRDRKKLVEEGKKVHTEYGVVDLTATEVGAVRSHLGHEFLLSNPRTVDIYEKMPRAGSYILKKDMGTILAHTGVGSGDIVVDAGTGSGGMAITLANIVRPGGRVYTYEIREKFAAIAQRNFAIAGLSEYIELKLRDIREGIEEEADVITLDLPDPWTVAGSAFQRLRPGGCIAIYNPYVEQARRSVEALRKEGFRDIRTLEIFEREMEFPEWGTRPKTRMLGHTAYLTFGRRF